MKQEHHLNQFTLGTGILQAPSCGQNACTTHLLVVPWGWIILISKSSPSEAATTEFGGCPLFWDPKSTEVALEINLDKKFAEVDESLFLLLQISYPN